MKRLKQKQDIALMEYSEGEKLVQFFHGRDFTMYHLHRALFDDGKRPPKIGIFQHKLGNPVRFFRGGTLFLL